MHWLALRWLPEPAPETGALPGGGPAGDAVAAAVAVAASGASPVRAAVSTEALGWWALGFTPHVAW